MTKYVIGWGVGGGYGGINSWAIVDHPTEDDAITDAYQRSYAEVESTVNLDNCIDLDGCEYIDPNSDEYVELINEEIESWLDYEVTELSKVDPKDAWKIEDARDETS